MNDETPQGVALLSKTTVLERLSRKKTWLHELMNPASKYYDATFPLPIYLGNSRNPLWLSTDLDAWIASTARRSRRPVVIRPDEPTREQVDEQVSRPARLGPSFLVRLAALARPVQPPETKTLVVRSKGVPAPAASDPTLPGNGERQAERHSCLMPSFPRLDELSRHTE